jgi:hypothetical protein
MTRSEKACLAVLILFALLGVWAFLIAAGYLPAMPWSPIGKAEHHHHIPHHVHRLIRGEQA